MSQHKSTPHKRLSCIYQAQITKCFSYFTSEVVPEMLGNNSLELNQPFSSPTSILSIQPGYKCFATGAGMQGAG